MWLTGVGRDSLQFKLSAERGNSMMIRFLSGVAIVSAMMIGCSDPGAKFKANPVTYPKWDALDKIFSEEVMRPIAMPAAEKDWSGVKAGAATAEFKAAVDTFAKAEIPAEFASAERKSAKEDAVKHYRALIKAAENNAAASEIQAAYEAATKSMVALRKPVGAEE